MKYPYKSKSTPTSAADEIEPKMKSEVFLVLRDVFFVFAPVFGFCIGAIELTEAFGINMQWLKSFGTLGLYLVGIHSLVIGLCYSTLRFILRWRGLTELAFATDTNETQGSKKLSSELIKIVERSYKNKEFLEVVRFGSPLSRPLLLSGMHATRAVIGERVADAAAKKGMHEEQVLALIDDVGWSNVLLGNIDKATKTIEYGVKLAEQHNLLYYCAKGERHLAGVYQWYRKDVEQAHEHYTRALGFANRIKEKHSKNEMKAGMLFGQADLYRIEGKFQEALKLATESKELYEKLGDQEERVVKAYSQLGRIRIGLGNLQTAEDIFHEGFEAAQQLKRKDEMGRNLLGLGEVYVRSGDYSIALESLNEALQIFEETELTQEAKEAKRLIAEAEVGLRQQ